MEKVKVEVLDKVRPKLEYLEEQRRTLSKQAGQRNNRVLFTSFICFALVCICLLSLGWMTGLIFIILALLFAGGAILYANNQQAPTVQALHQTIGDAILEEIYPKWRFSATNYLEEQRFKHLGIFPRFNRIEGGNLIHGRHGETDFSFSFLELRYDKGKNNRTVFEGLILVADFHKNIEKKTLVFPDVAQKVLGDWLGKKVQEFGWQGMELIYLENPAFEEQFSVYSTDQIEARYVLTPAMMDNLLGLSRKYDNNLSFCFTKGTVCVAINQAKTFEFNLHDEIHPEGTLQYFNRPIETVKEIIDVLQLNTRIWDKK